MVDPELQDLLPLFLKEGRRRVEHLLELAGRLADPEERLAVAVEARRELHTLKGSSRMLKLRHLAELCHDGESLLTEVSSASAGELTAVLDRVSEMLEALERSGAEVAAAAAHELLPRAPAELVAESETEIVQEHRISAEGIGRLTGAVSAIRLLAIAGLSSSQRLHELASLAESSVREELPHQILAMLATHLRQVAGELETQQHRLQLHAEAQLGHLLDLELQPLRPFLQSLARHARDLARKLGRELDVEIVGGEAKLDQRIAGELRGAFLHLVANAVDHGVEEPARRLEIGKPAAGRLRLSATSHGNRVELAVADDGAGIDPAQVLDAAREAGLIDPTTELLPRDTLQLLFTTGFSTRRQVSEVSGRGVGLDAVASAVRQLGGDVWIESQPGRGTSVMVEVPAARRGERVLVLRCGFDRLALPKSAVRWMRGGTADESVDLDAARGAPLAVIEVEGELLRVVHLADALGVETGQDPPVLVALNAAGDPCVLAVDAIEGEEEVLVRPFGRRVPAPEVTTGMALLTSGEPVAVLSPRALASTRRRENADAVPRAAPARLRVLLVEDSLVTREMERRMLEEEGFLVTAAPDAEDALSRLGEETYDCLVTDLEMSGMDGFELTRLVRETERLAQLPIIVVSTRDAPADRLAGLEAGADAYISKQALESHKLGRLIRRLGGRG